MHGVIQGTEFLRVLLCCKGACLFKISLLDDRADNLRLMAAGICLMIVGGCTWLDFVLT